MKTKHMDRPLPRQQRGISLILVLMIMVLVILTVVTASRSAMFNESVTSNEADYHRAVSAAEALIADAQADIRKAGCFATRNQTQFEGCRAAPTGDPTLANPFFPEDGADATKLRDALANACVQGICAPQTWTSPPVLADNFWLNNLAAVSATGATYGQFTGAAPAGTGNPILTANPARAWYWAELVPDFNDAGCQAIAVGGAPCTMGPLKLYPFVYRITAVARGLRGDGNTVAVIQTYFVPDPK